MITTTIFTYHFCAIIDPTFVNYDKKIIMEFESLIEVFTSPNLQYLF